MDQAFREMRDSTGAEDRFAGQAILSGLSGSDHRASGRLTCVKACALGPLLAVAGESAAV